MLLLMTGLTIGGLSARQTVLLKGKVLSAQDSLPLPGATIKVASSNSVTVADSRGIFQIAQPDPEDVLIISFLGFHTQEIAVRDLSVSDDPLIYLSEEVKGLDEVTVLSTGFQEIPKERATGSFVQVDNALINRKVSTGLLDRLEDVTPSLIFNRGTGSSDDPVSIRGRNTLFAETQPLIIVDNFPYDGPLENINPNDVEGITVLRDAAAASIWGARSGNGVIVIRTKSGSFQTPLQVSFNSNVNFIQRPDLLARPQMTVSEFIGVEEMLFENGNYDSKINQNSRPALSPVVETLLAHREGLISETEKDNALANYASYSGRSSLRDDFYHTALNQQYSLGISGGTKLHRYSGSVGYDSNLPGVPGNWSKRYTLSLQNDWRSKNQRLELGASVYWAQATNETGTEVPSLEPYERLKDETGLPLSVIRDFNSRYVSQLGDMGFLDGTYVPLREIGLSSNRSDQSDARLNVSLSYKLTPWLKATGRYQYWSNVGETRHHRPLQSYYTRWLINRYTQTSPEGTLSYPVPMGGILDQGSSTSQGNYLRGQFNVDHSWNEAHEIHGIAGAELKELQGLSSGTRFYGYDDGFGLSLPVDYLTRYRINPNNSLSTVPNGDDHTGIVDRFVSVFANMSYSYKKRYLLTASMRKDASNLFGVNANQRGVPLWSAGMGWTVSEESFYRSGLIPYLKLRTTFGYNGNVDKSISAFTTAAYYITAANTLNPGERAAQIMNPPNPNLRWERIQLFNAGMDFGLKNNLLDGSLEFYVKNGQDLIGNIPVPPSMGLSQFRGNFASTQTKGLDLELRSSPVMGELRWDINLFHSVVKEKVTGYEITPRADLMVSGLQLVPVKGNPLFSVYSFPWAGLDPDTGDPRGFLDGNPSTDYTAIRAGLTPESVVFHGSARPTSFGSFRNTVSYKGFSLSLNITYRLGYYFRRNTVDYVELANGRITHSDYRFRWQEKGDENTTQVPSMPMRVNSNRQSMYALSEITVERGDHVRLQDIRIAYRLDKKGTPWLPFRSAEVYSYAGNLGLIWKKTKYEIDPDFQNLPPQRSVALGLRIDL
ncbi:SusC/RagA family TonB-linked outer membrane protein [Algoriphagus sp. D3-2-R+10]|uniref:SusC/RagA family TonB-linked outer membrane protein n=1 Tax=Algoriphagus aurantiacus TaxID=3103948 RepID=UPI002B3F97F4|nr:SusC/RagA family TonB-linked outer membrane protein [Algoriphagus sp. D3-2-R+10]MEB2777486.1 SusC/RagA family TonB-linked outer membrane protein [Algoriphagus sp. D3-2-R+10]